MFFASSADEELPAWRAGAQIALLLDGKALAAMAEDAKEVWAENPTSVQHAFPEGADEVLARYRREWSLSNPNTSVARVKFVVEQQGGIWGTVVGSDKNGATLDRPLIRMNVDPELFKHPMAQRPGYEGQPIGQTIVIPEEVREARTVLADWSSYHKPDKETLLTKWKPKLLDPVHFEPTQWHLGEELVLAADGLDKNLIGTVNDVTGGRIWLNHAYNPNAEAKTPSQILLRYAPDLLPETDGWLVARSHERHFRYSRSKGRELLAQTVREGGVSVNAAAQWAAQSTDRSPFIDWMGNYLDTLYAQRGSANNIQMLSDYPDLRMWASLGDGVLDSLRHGGTVRLSTLTSDAQTQIAHLVYWFDRLDEEKVDPTDRVPNGIADGIVTMTTTAEPLIQVWSSQEAQSVVPNTTSIRNIGGMLAEGSPWFKKIDRFRVGVHRTYDLHFTLNPGRVPMTISLDEELIDPNAEALTQLPPNLRAEVEKQRLDWIAHPPTPGEYPPTPPPAKQVIPPQ